MPLHATYRQGRIVWALLRSSQKGKKQQHPAVIISADSDIVQPEFFDPRKDIDKVNAVAVIGVSTKYRNYPPYVQLPYSSRTGGHPITKLTQDCAACIGWYDWVVLEDEVLARGGDVPKMEMDKIVDAVLSDLKANLKRRKVAASSELAGINRLIADLMGEA